MYYTTNYIGYTGVCQAIVILGNNISCPQGQYFYLYYP